MGFLFQRFAQGVGAFLLAVFWREVRRGLGALAEDLLRWFAAIVREVQPVVVDVRRAREWHRRNDASCLMFL